MDSTTSSVLDTAAIVVVGELVTLAVNVGAGALGGYVVGRFV